MGLIGEVFTACLPSPSRNGRRQPLIARLQITVMFPLSGVPHPTPVRRSTCGSGNLSSMVFEGHVELLSYFRSYCLKSIDTTKSLLISFVFMFLIYKQVDCTLCIWNMKFSVACILPKLSFYINVSYTCRRKNQSNRKGSKAHIHYIKLLYYLK